MEDLTRVQARDSPVSRAHRRNIEWEFAALALMLAGPPSINPALADEKTILEFEDGRHFQGQVQSAVVDRQGVAWIATPHGLFKIEGGKPVLVESSGSRDRLLAVAPGGERYFWLDSRKAQYGQFAIEMFDLSRPGTFIAELKSTELPHEFGALHFSREGKLLVGVTALDDPEGLRGNFGYTLWSRTGKPLGNIAVTGRRVSIPDERGESLLLLGESEAAAHRSDGELLWIVSGRFRKGVLGNAGSVGLLNPASKINEVHVVHSGKVSSVLDLRAPVYELAITPDGTSAAAAAGAGKLWIFRLAPPGGPVISAKQLPSPILSRYHISSVRFVDRETLALGIIRSYGPRPFARFYAAEVLVQKTTGEPIRLQAIRLPETPSWGPALDVTFGRPVIAAYTPRSVVFVDTSD